MARIDRDSRQLKETLDLLRQFMQLTKTGHDMFFMGINKVPPNDKQRELKRMFRELPGTVINNTALRFQYKMLKARYNSLKMYWLRTTKQMKRVLTDGTVS